MENPKFDRFPELMETSGLPRGWRKLLLRQCIVVGSHECHPGWAQSHRLSPGVEKVILEIWKALGSPQGAFWMGTDL